MHPDPLITIIIATYNSEKILDSCIKSITGQTSHNYELIIIDGGSKDNTIEIIKKNAPVITNWISEPDNGIYDAWNKGIKLAKGDWIMFIGSDDALYPDALARYTEYIKNAPPDLDYISSRMHIVNEKNKIIRTFGRAWNWQRFRKNFIIAHPGSLHARNYFERYGLYDTSFKICGDYDMLLRAGENLKAGYIDAVTLKMALGGVSDTSKVFKESYFVIKNTGGLPETQARMVLIELYIKYYIKRFFRLFGLYVKGS